MRPHVTAVERDDRLPGATSLGPSDARPNAGIGPAPQEAAAVDPRWWRHAVIYEIYIRSFADANGDGTGDLAGVRSRLRYLRDLGVDAVWFTPWYVSPLADGGYDVADYRRIDPAFGDLAEAEALIAEARSYGIRTIVDVVPNHVSSQHPWFRAALDSAPGSPERSRFWFHPGRGADGEQMPTAWASNFGGPTWTRTAAHEGRPGEWYLHLFSEDQPDLNWNHPDVRREFEDVLRFWFDRGAAGIRIDSAALLVKDAELPEVPDQPGPGEHPNVDRDEIHAIYRSWRAVADSYADSKALVGEVWLADAERFVRYLRPDELHTAFNFDFLARPWAPAELRTSIDQARAAHAPVDAPATWLLSNHDVTRPVTRYGRRDSSFSFTSKRRGTPTDLSAGRRRARAAALLAAALPGSLYIYQGDELGLDEVEDLPAEHLQDPMVVRSGGVDPGRDGCRVPLPWSGSTPPFGFSPPDGRAETWLPQPSRWATFTVEAQQADEGSMLALYRRSLAIRRSDPDLVTETFAWLPSGPDVLAFRRGDRFVSITNFGTGAAAAPEGAELLLASGDLIDGRLPTDTSAWWRLGAAPEDER
jgi:alpha-glucosidase